MKKNAKDFKIVIAASRGRDYAHVDHVSGERTYRGAGPHSPFKYERNSKYKPDLLEEYYEEQETEDVP